MTLHSSTLDVDSIVYTVRAMWEPSVWHFGATPKGLRDSIPVSVAYRHAGKQKEMKFDLQAKFYDKKRAKRAAKARNEGKRFQGATCRYYAANEASARRWSYEEVPADKTSGTNLPLDIVSAWRAPPTLPPTPTAAAAKEPIDNTVAID